MYEIKYGSKYNKDMDVKEIAKHVRNDIKAAIKTGKLPKGTKTSVRIARFSMGRSLDVEVKSLGNITIRNPEREKWESENPNKYPGEAPSRYTDKAYKAFETLKSMMDAYNYDGSEPETDYYNVNFYGHVTYRSIIVG